MRQQSIGRLSAAERARSQTLLGQGTAPARRLTHARRLLKANHGEPGPAWTDAVIAGALEAPPASVARVRRTDVTAGLEAALPRTPPDRRQRLRRGSLPGHRPRPSSLSGSDDRGPRGFGIATQ